MPLSFRAGPNFFYLTGMPISVNLGAFALLLSADGRGYWIGRRTEMSNVRTFAQLTGWSEEGGAIADEEDLNETLARYVSKIAGTNASVGVELATGFLSPAAVDVFRRTAPSIKLVNFSGIVEELRVIKSAGEIELLRQSGRMTSETLKRGIASIKEGMTDFGIGRDTLQRGAAAGQRIIRMGSSCNRRSQKCDGAFDLRQPPDNTRRTHQHGDGRGRVPLLCPVFPDRHDWSTF